MSLSNSSNSYSNTLQNSSEPLKTSSLNKKQFPWQAKDEKVLLFTREHLLNFIKNNLINISTIIWWSTIIAVLTFVFSENFILSIAACVLTLTISFSILSIFWFKTYLIITNKRILKSVKNWIFSEHMKELKLDQLNELNFVRKWIISKFLNIWNIKIVWKDKENTIWFQWVKYPDEIVLYISRLRDFLKENPNFPVEKLKPFIPRKMRKKD